MVKPSEQQMLQTPFEPMQVSIISCRTLQYFVFPAHFHY